MKLKNAIPLNAKNDLLTLLANKELECRDEYMELNGSSEQIYAKDTWKAVQECRKIVQEWLEKDYEEKD